MNSTSSNLNSTDTSDSVVESIRGTVARVTYRNTENDYTVLQLDVEDERQTITVVGYCLPFTTGSSIIVNGELIKHPKFGEQLQARTADEIEPTTKQGMIKYLGSGLLPGIGPKTAERIVKQFGLETLEVIHRTPEKLAKVTGISHRKAAAIHTTIKERKDKLECERFFAENDISIGLARRIINTYGEKAITKVNENPYCLMFEVRGIGFRTADSIALRLGFAVDSDIRIRGALFASLQDAKDNGHCYLEYNDLIENTATMLELGSEIDFQSHVDALCEQGFVTTVEERVYIRKLYQAEQQVAAFISSRIGPRDRPFVDENTRIDSLERAERDLGIEFSYEQKHAVELATKFRFLVVTGGPGCGKTTIIRALAATFSKAGKTLALAAPTGKAAQRMSQVTDMNARTIHRLLKFDPRTGSFQYNGTAPLCIEEQGEELEVEALIIDEASMLDIQLCRDLFSAIPMNATVVLVGDKDQLPSVGPGRVFAELVSIPELKVISLSKLFRRSEESRITSIAHTINSGITPEIPVPDGVTKSDIYFLEKDDPEDCAKLIESLVAEQIPDKFNMTLSDITVLTPSNRGPIGTIELNKRLQERLNPASKQKSTVSTYNGDFRLGDRVCQRVNNYKIDLFGVFNGDIGEVYQLDESDSSLVVELWDGRLIRYTEKDLKQLSLSYAMTVHRSQGSEMPCVVLVLHTTHFTLLERQLFYTAITRAKQLLIIVGSSRAIQLATKRVNSRNRLTSLKEAICAELHSTAA